MIQETGWRAHLASELNAPYMKELKRFLAEERARGALVYPPPDRIFRALSLTPFDRVKVVIVGQDPYHGPGQADGLSFSVPPAVPLPPSLRNIFKELSTDLGIPPASHGCLVAWAQQGVLLLNATLTVRAAEPKSHYGRGWERLTNRILTLLAAKQEPIVFVLWGKAALETGAMLFPVAPHHLVLMAPHPSPFSAHTGFFGCGHFSRINAFLVQQGMSPIDWALPDGLSS